MFTWVRITLIDIYKQKSTSYRTVQTAHFLLFELKSQTGGSLKTVSEARFFSGFSLGFVFAEKIEFS
jgi:hypothetical protein